MMALTKKNLVRCPLHIDKTKDVYCHTCEQPMCLRCMFNNHRNHDCTELEMAARRKREILRRLARAIADLLSKLNARRDDLIDVTSRAHFLRERIGNDVDIVLYTPGLRRRFEDIMGNEMDITKLEGWPDPGAYAERLNQYVHSQQSVQLHDNQQGQYLGIHHSAGFQAGQSGQHLSRHMSTGFKIGQSNTGFPSAQPCLMCPSQIPCTQPKEGLLMVCHCKHPPSETQAKGQR